MCRLEHDGGRLSRVERLLPTRRAEAPAVAGYESGKAVRGHRCAQVVALGAGELEEFGGHHDANTVHSGIVAAALAATVAVETRERVEAAQFELATENVPGHPEMVP